MDRATLIATIGQRDLYYNVAEDGGKHFLHFLGTNRPDLQTIAQSLGCPIPGARHFGAALHARLTDAAGDAAATARRLTYPIIGTIIDSVLASEGDRLPIRLVLVGTDQLPPGRALSDDPRARAHGDTYDCARVVAELIRRDYAGRVDVAEVRKHTDPPHLLGPAYRYFERLLPEIIPADSMARVYAANSGGTPQLTEALSRQVQRRYRHRSRLEAAEASLDHETGTPRGKRVSVPTDYFMQELVRDLVGNALDRNDYAGALSVLRDTLAASPSIRFWDDRVEAALSHASCRANSDYTQAAQELSEYHSVAPLARWYAATNRPILFQRLSDLCSLTAAYQANGAYADMLVRVALFYEHGLRQTAALLWPTLGLETGKSEFSSEELTALDPALPDSVAAKLPTIPPPWMLFPNLSLALCQHIFEQQTPAADDRTRALSAPCQRAVEAILPLRKLYDLRHALIHRLTGPSLHELGKALKDGIKRSGRGPAPADQSRAPEEFAEHIVPMMREALQHLAAAVALRQGQGEAAAPAVADQFAEIRAYVREALARAAA